MLRSTGSGLAKKTWSKEVRFVRPSAASPLLITLLLFVLGCSKVQSKSASAPPAKVTVTTALEQEITDFDDFVGRTEASETVEVRSRVSGFIDSIQFQDGSQVEKGQLLFEIEPDSYQAIYDQSLARIELWEAKRDLAEKKLARSKLLIPNGAISKEEYEESVSAVKEAEAAKDTAIADAKRTELDVKYTKIRAEIAGRIDRAFVTRGNMVTGGLGSGTLLTRIVSNHPMYAYLDVDERTVLRYLRRMNPSTQDAPSGETLATPASENPARVAVVKGTIPCYMQLADEKDFPHAGTLDFVENRVDSATGSVKVRGVFPNTNSMLTGGLFVRIRIPVSEPYRGVLIPEQAIGTDQNIKFAYVVGSDNIPQRRNLVLGAQSGAMRVVKSGIEPNQKVIYRGLQRVRPGKAVEPELVDFIDMRSDSGTTPTPVVPKPAIDSASQTTGAYSNPK
ncbi:MAG: efflux RND transporter periplasmic adaptor subunit [Pirellula sp.]